jgi:tetratricopeptide (TPR) repeat protein
LSFAQVAGPELTRQAVHLIESGRARPSAWSLEIIAARLGVSVSTLTYTEPGDLEQLCQRQEFQRAVERGTHILEVGGPPELIGFAHYFTGQALHQLIRYEEALDHLRQARETFETIGNEAFVAESMDWEAITLHRMEDSRALPVAEAALDRYRRVRSRQPETEARMLEHMGTILKGRGDFARARACYEQALQVAGGVRELARLARLNHGLANCHRSLGDLRRGSELLLKAVALYEAEQRISPDPNRVDLPGAENDLGMLVMEQGDLERAEELFQSALRGLEASSTGRLRSYVLLSMSDLRQRQGRLDAAVRLAGEAQGSAERCDETRARAIAHQQLAELHAALGEYESAEDNFRRALVILEQAGLGKRYSDCLEAYQRVQAQRRGAERERRELGA